MSLVVTRGFGSFGSVYNLPALGYALQIPTPPGVGLTGDLQMFIAGAEEMDAG